jgi:hypothetical protein
LAKQRWATLSVADHLDLRALVPDVLLFDRLAFPYPADQAEWRLWVEQGWDPDLLDHCLGKLDKLALPFDWGKEQHRQFRTNMEQAQHLVGRAAVAVRVDNPDDAKSWEIAKGMTRQMIASSLQRDLGDDLWVMPSYQSRAAFLKDQQIEIAAPSRESRREALVVLVGQEMVVPDDADPHVAFDRAVRLAQDEAYQVSRRALYNWQEDVIQREQSRKDDARELADLMFNLHKHVEKAGAKTRRQWLFFVLKRAANASKFLHPAEWPNLLIEAAEVVFGEPKPEIPPGPTAVFQHMQRKVIGPARPRKPWWRG